MTDPTDTQPCGTCQAPLADDQRYCLNCGTRRGEPRMDPLAHLMPADGAATTAVAPAVVSAPARGVLGPSGLPLLGALAVLAALGVGFLIGAGRDEAPVIAQRPPVVNITSAAGGPAAATTATETDAKADAGSTAKKSKADSRTGKDAEEEIEKAGGKVLSDAELAASKNLSPEEARKRSAKLPSVVGTGGAPPATDKKQAGAGTDAEVIK